MLSPGAPVHGPGPPHLQDDSPCCMSPSADVPFNVSAGGQHPPRRWEERNLRKIVLPPRIQHPLEESFVLVFISTFAFVFLTILISIPAGLLLITLFPFVLLIRSLGVLCSSLRCSSNYYQECLSPFDAQFFLHEGSSVIHSVLIIDGSLSLNCIKNLLSTKVVEARSITGGLVYPRLTKLVVGLRGSWVWTPDDAFNIHNHVFLGPTISSEDSLQRYVATLLSNSLHPSRPLWEVIVIQDFGPSHDTVLVCRVHQCISDGMSLVRILCQSLSDNQILHIPLKRHFGGAAYGMNIVRAMLIGPLTFLKWLWWWKPEDNFLKADLHCSAPRVSSPTIRKTSLCSCSRQKSSRSDSDSSEAAYTLWQESSSQGQVVKWGSGVALNRITRVKQITRTSVNDVLLAALTGALRLSFQKKGISNPSDLKVGVAVDLRNNSLPFQAPRLGTKATVVPLELPLSCEAAVPRLWKVKATMEEMKASADPVVSFGLVWWAYHLLTSSWSKDLFRRLHSRTSVLYSSLPGPTSAILIGGYTVKHIYNVSPPWDPTLMSVTLFTYSDQIHVSVAVKKQLPHAGQFAKSVLREFQSQCFQLSSLLSYRRIPGEQRRGLVFSTSELNSTKSLSDLQEKLIWVQRELHRVAMQYEKIVNGDSSASSDAFKHKEDSEEYDEDPCGASCEAALIPSPSEYNLTQQELANKVLSLKDEFTEILQEMHRRKSNSSDVSFSSNNERVFEGETSHKRMLRSLSSRDKLSSCTARPLTTEHLPLTYPIDDPEMA